MSITQVSCNKIFGGEQRVYSHESSEVGCTMKFGVFLPAEALAGTKLPVILYLSGRTCSEQNFITKAGAQRLAADLKLIIVNPDTSPRGVNVEGEDGVGPGASYYIDATTEKWKKNYRMYSYILKEFLSLVDSNFPTIPDRKSIFGHSMGGHGALIMALKNPGLFRCVSAFAPVANPCLSPSSPKYFGAYLGEDKEAWKAYDATELVKNYDGPPLDILIDQGAADEFYHQKRLLPENFEQACLENNIPCELRIHEDYDHNYYFIATFIEEHLKRHSKHLHQ